jgi:type II secretory pathway component PulF
MDVRRAVPFALEAAGSPYYSRHVPEVSAALERGDDLFSALARTGAFPDEFLDAIQVGEQSGRSDESMLRLADQYQDHARSALATLTMLAGFAVWALVALMIIAIIFSIVSAYSNMLQDLSKPR